MAHTLKIPSFKVLRQEDKKLEASLAYTVRPCLKLTNSEIPPQINKVLLFKPWAGDMVQEVKMLASKPPTSI